MPYDAEVPKDLDAAKPAEGASTWAEMNDADRETRKNIKNLNAIATKTGAYTLTAQDHIVLCNTNTFTITLPVSSTVGSSTFTKIYIIKNLNTVNLITIDANGSETIDGASTWVLAPGETVIIASDGTANWQGLSPKISPKRVSVSVGSNQDIPGSGATTVIQLNSELYDVLNEFNITNYRFTPSVAGGYLAIANIRMDYLANAGVLTAYIRRTSSGGSESFFARQGVSLSSTTSGQGSLSAIIEMATSDYLELVVTNDTTGLVRIPVGPPKMEIVRLW